MSFLLFVVFIYFMASLTIALVRFIVDTFKYPIFCKVLKKNIKMFKRYQRQYKALLKDLEKEKKEVNRLRNELLGKDGVSNEVS